MRFILCMWLSEISSCSCLKLFCLALPGSCLTRFAKNKSHLCILNRGKNDNRQMGFTMDWKANQILCNVNRSVSLLRSRSSIAPRTTMALTNRPVTASFVCSKG